MNSSHQNEGDQQKSPLHISTQPGYLYHKQKPPTKSRHPRKPRGSSGGNVRAPDRAASAQDAFLANLKTFGVVAACMVVMLMAAIKIYNKSWQIKQSRRVAPLSEPAGKSASGSTARSLAAANALKGSSETLDTEAMQDALLLMKRGDALSEAGNFEEAIDVYRSALSTWPHLHEAWAKLGRTHLHSGHLSDAKRAFESGVEVDGKSAALHNDLAVTLIHMGRIRKAIGSLDAALHADVEYAPSYFNLALCYLKLGEHRRAEDYLNKYLQRMPGDARALRELAYLQAHRGQYQEALEVLEEAIESKKDWPALYLDAAAASALSQQDEEAIRYLQQAKRYASSEVVYQVYLQPAFHSLRSSEAGLNFEKQLRADFETETHQETATPSLDVTMQPLESEDNP